MDGKHRGRRRGIRPGRAIDRKVKEDNENYVLRESQTSYRLLLAPEKHALSPENSIFWGIFYSGSIS